MSKEMTLRITKIATRLSIMLFLVLASLQGNACDRSLIALDSVVFDGSNYNIYITQNMGAGITGSQKGAGADTYTFAYGFYGAASLSYSFATPSLTGDSTGITNTAFNLGPVFGTIFTIGYISPGLPFACVSSTAGCGNVHTDVKQVHFVLNAIPDSIRLFGLEGTGNPIAGCYPDPDMLVDFTILPVEWAGISGQNVQEGIQVDWATAQEVNASHFAVQHSPDGIAFEEIGSVNATGNSTVLQNYSFVDMEPKEGTNFYRVVEVDQEGKRSASDVVSVEYSLDATFAWTTIAPNPVESIARVGYSVPEDAVLSLVVFDLKGSVHAQREIQAIRGTNSEELDLSGLPSGMYIVRLLGNQGRLDKKIIKL